MFRTVLYVVCNVQVCGEKAPFGWEGTTVVDANVRSTWRFAIGPDVLVTNPAFTAAVFSSADRDTESALKEEYTPKSNSNSYSQSTDNSPHAGSGMLDVIKRKLFPDLVGRGELVAQPYQMLIYEKGDFFEEHVDTLRGPSHLGSLCISLPVVCDTVHDASSTSTSSDGMSQTGKGGTLVLYDADGSSYSCPAASTYSCEWTAFFTDIKHRVTPVVEGYRVSLSYHLLAILKDPSPSAFIPPSPHTPAIELLSSYLNCIFTESLSAVVMFPLSNQYNDANVQNLTYLRGVDMALYKVLLACIAIMHRSGGTEGADLACELPMHTNEHHGPLNVFTWEKVVMFGMNMEFNDRRLSYGILCPFMKLLEEKMDFKRNSTYFGNDCELAGFVYGTGVICVQGRKKEHFPSATAGFESD